MKRLLPATLSGRLILTLLIGLLGAQLLGAAILLRDRASAIYQTSGLAAAQRIAGIVQVLDRLDPAARTNLLPALNSPQLRVALASTLPPVEATEELHAAHLRTVLQRLLGDGRTIQVTLIESVPAVEAGARRGPGRRHPHLGPQAQYLPP